MPIDYWCVPIADCKVVITLPIAILTKLVIQGWNSPWFTYLYYLNLSSNRVCKWTVVIKHQDIRIWTLVNFTRGTLQLSFSWIGKPYICLMNEIINWNNIKAYLIFQSFIFCYTFYWNLCTGCWACIHFHNSQFSIFLLERMINYNIIKHKKLFTYKNFIF